MPLIMQCGAALGDNCRLTKLTASNASPGDALGISAALDGNVAVLGARIGPLNTGGAYVFRFDGKTWAEEQQLAATDGTPFSYFGRSVAIDGDVIVIGAFGANGPNGGSGAAYVFRQTGASWVFEQKLLPADAQAGDWIGWDVAVSGDFALVGAIGRSNSALDAGAAYLFVFDGDNWVEHQKLVPSDGELEDGFGGSVAISGNIAVIGAIGVSSTEFEGGAAYVFRHMDGTWLEEQKLVPADIGVDDDFGFSVAVNEAIVLVGSPGDDVQAEGTGSAYFYRHNGGEWQEVQKITASDGGLGDYFGWDVGISGDKAVVGTHGFSTDAAYVFGYNGSNWIEQDQLSSMGSYGEPVAIDGQLSIVGALADDDACPSDPFCNSGAAYVFALGPDCNGNTTADACDIRDAVSLDENSNSIPDECEIVYGDVAPAGGNGLVDVDDLLHVLDGFSDPVQFPAADVFPCNGNGVIDVDDILAELDAFSGIAACVWDNGMWVPN